MYTMIRNIKIISSENNNYCYRQPIGYTNREIDNRVTNKCSH